MKKLFSILTTTAIVFGMTVTTYADPAANTFPDVDVQYHTITSGDPSIPEPGNEDDERYQIPVYGYVGADANLVDKGDDAGDSTIPPSSLSLINVRVPVKIIWAAFASDYIVGNPGSTTISSPDYYIQNLSFKSGNTSYGSDLKVSVKSFNPVTTNNYDANTIKDQLTLTFDTTGSAVGTTADAKPQDSWDLIADRSIPLPTFDLLGGSLGAGHYLSGAEVVRTDSSSTLLHGDGRTKLNAWTFKIGGSYEGAPPEDISYAPEYNITFMFEVDTTTGYSPTT